MTDEVVRKVEWLLSEGAGIIKDQADEIERLRNCLQKFANTSNLLIGQTYKLLGSPHPLWGAINDLSTMADVANQGLAGNWDYDPYERSC